MKEPKLKKESTMTIRLSKETKELLKKIASKENRTQANLVETLILKYCEEKK